MEDRRCRLGLQGRLELALLIEQGSTLRAAAAELRRRIGLAGQYAAVEEHLTGLENLTMVGRLYGMKRLAATAR